MIGSEQPGVKEVPGYESMIQADRWIQVVHEPEPGNCQFEDHPL